MVTAGYYSDDGGGLGREREGMRRWLLRLLG